MKDIDTMHQNQNRFVESIERMKGGAIERLEWDKLYQLLDELTDESSFNLHPLTPTSKFARGRILTSANEFSSIRELSYPNEDLCTSFGRCNKPKKPILYAGIGTELVLSEIGAKVGDVIGLLHMSPIRDLLCVRLGALDLWRRTSGHCLMNEDIKQSIKNIHLDPKNITAFLLDAFVSDYFSRKGATNTYKLTSAYTEVILNMRPDVVGLIYDSVNHEAGACIAIKPDTFDTSLRPTEVQIIQITSYLGYGIYDFKQLCFANKFDGDKIIWDRTT